MPVSMKQFEKNGQPVSSVRKAARGYRKEQVKMFLRGNKSAYKQSEIVNALNEQNSTKIQNDEENPIYPAQVNGILRDLIVRKQVVVMDISGVNHYALAEHVERAK